MGILTNHNINPGQPVPLESPTVSLSGLLDLLTVMSPELSELPSPYPLFAHELEVVLAESLGVSGDG